MNLRLLVLSRLQLQSHGVVSFADRFERVMVFERQRLVEDGAPDALADTSETFQALVA